MKLGKPGLIAQILIAIALGALIGNFTPAPVIRALNTFKDIFAQLVRFLVPLIIIGLVTPAIADTGRAAGRMLLVTVGIAYASTVFAGFFSFFVPLLPFYVMSVIADTAACGRLSAIAGPCVKLMVSCLAITLVLLLIQYAVAGAVARRNPLKSLWNMMPAYLMGFGSCSSAATLPVTLRQTMKNGVSEDTANLVIPLCANIHMTGSMSNMVAYAIGLIVLAGEPVSLAAFTEYIFMISVIAVASPGIPGGVVLASATVAETAFGFSPERYAIMIAIYMALDGMGTACNLTGDGAIALVVDRISAKTRARAA